MNHSRRSFLKHSASAAAAVSLAALAQPPASGEEMPPLFKISLAEWSLHKTLFSGKMSNLDFAKAAKEEYGIDAVEYVNQNLCEQTPQLSLINVFLTIEKKREHKV